MLICAGNSENFSFAEPIGIGLIDSCINLTRIMLFNKPEFLLFIGTAGSYGEYKPFDIIESRSAVNIESAFLENKAYTPIDNAIKLENKLCENMVGVNSSNYICTSKDLGKQYLSYGQGIENMEFYSILKVAKEFEVRAGGIFIITNYTDENAHSDFIKNHSKAKSLLSSYLLEKKIITEIVSRGTES